MWGKIKVEQCMMDLADVKQCEQCYIVYEPEDGASHLFKRLRTDDGNILFERELTRWAKSQPYFSIDKYGLCWFAFAEKPRKCVVDYYRKKVANYIKLHMPWYAQAQRY